MNQLTGKINSVTFTPGHPEAIAFRISLGIGTLPAILDASKPDFESVQAKGGPIPDNAENQWGPWNGMNEIVGGLAGGINPPPFVVWGRFWLDDDNTATKARFIITSPNAPEPTEEQWA